MHNNNTALKTTVNITPKWESMVPFYVAMIINCHDNQRILDDITKELKKMARLADLYVDTNKAND